MIAKTSITTRVQMAPKPLITIFISQRFSLRKVEPRSCDLNSGFQVTDFPPAARHASLRQGEGHENTNGI